MHRDRTGNLGYQFTNYKHRTQTKNELLKTSVLSIYQPSLPAELLLFGSWYTRAGNAETILPLLSYTVASTRQYST